MGNENMKNIKSQNAIFTMKQFDFRRKRLQYAMADINKEFASMPTNRIANRKMPFHLESSSWIGFAFSMFSLV